MAKVKLDVLRPWISKKITDILHIEDDVVVEFVFNQLEEEKVTPWIIINQSANLRHLFSVPLSQEDADQHDRISERPQRSPIHGRTVGAAVVRPGL